MFSYAGTNSDDGRGYTAGIYWVDQSVGVLYDYLTEQKALDNTIVIILSDNGEAKGTTYEYGVRTLLHVRWPDGGISSGTRITELVSNIDIVPTLLSIAVKPSYNTVQYDTDGVDISALLTGSATSLSRDTLYVEMSRDFAVIQEKFKLVFQSQSTVNTLANSGVTNQYSLWNTEFQLYDLSSDSCETTNVADSNADTLASLTTLKNTHSGYVTNNGCSTDLVVANTCESFTVSNADASDCDATEVGASCTVTCATG